MLGSPLAPPDTTIFPFLDCHRDPAVAILGKEGEVAHFRDVSAIALAEGGIYRAVQIVTGHEQVDLRLVFEFRQSTCNDQLPTS